MRRIDLVEATAVAWERLSPLQRDRFFREFVSAALRLDRVAMRDWLRKRLRNRPLAAPFDLTRFAVSDSDFALLMKAAREAPGESAARASRNEPSGG